jgi:hypothetical protein
MEGVVAEVRVRAPCKRFAIKGNGICDRSARGFYSHKAKPHSFFPLRTIRVVTRVRDRSTVGQSDLSAEGMQNATLICNNFSYVRTLSFIAEETGC